jgi:predicted nucleic acid-binding protein
MESEYLIDTNVLINYMSESLPESSLRFLDRLIDGVFNLFIINKIELLGFRNLTTTEEKIFTKLITIANVIPLHEGIVEETISIRKKTNIKLSDAVIAATAIFSNSILITSNIEDFAKIKNLNLRSADLL